MRVLPQPKGNHHATLNESGNNISKDNSQQSDEVVLNDVSDKLESNGIDARLPTGGSIYFLLADGESANKPPPRCKSIEGERIKCVVAVAVVLLFLCGFGAGWIQLGPSPRLCSV